MSKHKRIAYFGYGSLVNRETLQTPHLALLPASLKGWRRHWQCREHHPDMQLSPEVALLSVHRDLSTCLSGMLIVDEVTSLPQLDLREAHYDRVPIEISDLEIADDRMQQDLPETLFVYVGRRSPERRPTLLLQSYLDAVLSGYLREYGEEGIHHFLTTTIGFERPIVLDRHKPRYSRAVKVDAALARRFDELLAAAGVQFRESPTSDQ